MGLVNLIEFNILGDKRGSLISLEQCANVPFEIKRTYYIFNLDGNLPRGFHAHKELRQLAICVQGSCEVLLDDGTTKEEVLLNQPNVGLLIEPYQWHVMRNFTKDCVFLVLASDHYNESDYIRDYDEFIRSIE